MIELASVIRELREEISAAVEVADDEQIRFEVGTIELEVSVEITREGSGSGKVRFWVVEAGANGRVSRKTGNRIKIPLTPIVVEPDQAPAAGRRAYVSGTATARED